jgi:hypothetical protein
VTRPGTLNREADRFDRQRGCEGYTSSQQRLVTICQLRQPTIQRRRPDHSKTQMKGRNSSAPPFIIKVSKLIQQQLSFGFAFSSSFEKTSTAPSATWHLQQQRLQQPSPAAVSDSFTTSAIAHGTSPAVSVITFRASGGRAATAAVAVEFTWSISLNSGVKI